MPTDVPYLYAAPARYSSNDPYGGFDPKAVSRASLTPSPQKPKQTGPLLDFNKHPDSYLILPYGQTNATPMPESTKKHVNWARAAQLGFRALGMLGAMGTLAGVVMVKNTQDIESYVIRVPPAFDILFTAYALYHLARSARGRTPGSQTSYHFFASFIDATIVPFYVYIGLDARYRRAQPTTAEDRWTSLFNSPDAADKVMIEVWLIGITSAGLHFVNFIISVYLVIMFRRISNLPPDMNPLEDNLTSRRKTKHKYKNSEASNIDSGASLLSGRESTPKFPELSERPVSFLQTRNSSTDNVYNPHNPVTAHASRSSFFAPSHQVYSSAAGSKSSLAVTEMSTKDKFFAPSSPSRLRDTPTLPSIQSAPSIYSDPPALPRKSSKRVPDSNWMVVEGSEDGVSIDMNHNSRLSRINEAASKSNLRVHDAHDGDLGMATTSHAAPSGYASGFGSGAAESWQRDYRSLGPDSHLNPLEMNPPTPIHWRSQAGSPTGTYSSTTSGRKETKDTYRPLSALSAASQNSAANSPRGRKYGELAEVMQGMRASPKPEESGYRGGAMEEKRRAVSRRNERDARKTSVGSGEWMSNSKHHKANIKPSSNPYAFETDTNPSTYSEDNTTNNKLEPHHQMRGPERGQRRVASRSTGIDLADAPAPFDDWTASAPNRGGQGYGGLGHGDAFGGGYSGYGGNGRRNVSGKIAEEGQAGYNLGAWAGIARRRLAEGWK